MLEALAPEADQIFKNTIQFVIALNFSHILFIILVYVVFLISLSLYGLIRSLSLYGFIKVALVIIFQKIHVQKTKSFELSISIHLFKSWKEIKHIS